jgi:hypothetical protein
VLDLLGVEYLERTNRLMFCCPFHHDTDPSAGFYLDTELAHCFSCSYTIDPIDFYAKYKRVDRFTAEQDLAKELGEWVPKKVRDPLAEARRRAPMELALRRARERGLDYQRHAVLAEQMEEILHHSPGFGLFEGDSDRWYERLERSKRETGFDPRGAPAVGAHDRLQEGVGYVPGLGGEGGEVDLV